MRSGLWLTGDSIKYIDSVETETHVYIATERVRPLEGALRDNSIKGKAKEEWIGWGVKSVAVSHPVIRESKASRDTDTTGVDGDRIPELALAPSCLLVTICGLYHALDGVASGRFRYPDNEGRRRRCAVGSGWGSPRRYRRAQRARGQKGGMASSKRVSPRASEAGSGQRS